MVKQQSVPSVTPTLTKPETETSAPVVDPSVALASQIGNSAMQSSVLPTVEAPKVDPRRAMLEKHLIDSGRATSGGQASWADAEGPTTEDGKGPGKKLSITGGGPNELVRNKKSSDVLHGMERAINQNKVGDKLKAKGKSDDEIQAMMETPSGGDRIRPEDVAEAEKVDTNFAHFVGRHGAGEAVTDPSKVAESKKQARDAQIGRIVSGIQPDDAHAAPVDALAPTTSLTDTSGEDVTLPNFNKTGDDSGMASGGFSSHTAQLFAIEEGLSAAWNRKDSIDKTMDQSTTFDETTESMTARDPSKPGKEGAPKKLSNTVSKTEDQPINYSGRLGVNVALPKNAKGETPFEGGFGESFSMDKDWNKDNKLVKDAPLTPDMMQERLDHTTATADQEGASVILDEDAKRGGFTVQTAYPQQATATDKTTSDVSTSYRGEVTKARKIDAKGKTTETKKKALVEDVAVPEFVSPQLDEEARLAESLARMPPSKKEDIKPAQIIPKAPPI